MVMEKKTVTAMEEAVTVTVTQLEPNFLRGPLGLERANPSLPCNRCNQN
jgi:hypothetical protein